MTFVPRFRLLAWSAAVFMPLSLVLALLADLRPLALGASVLLIGLAGFDALASKDRLAGINVELPDVVRLSKGRQGDLVVRIENEGVRIKRLRIGLGFPREIFSESNELDVFLPFESALSSVRWPIQGLKQGCYRLQGCFLETPSRFGFWGVRARSLPVSEIRVYPNLFGERQKLAALFLNQGLGYHAQRQVGKGRDFEQLREYLFGDSYEDIHWKATAKRGQPVTKVYQIERTQQIYVVVDASRLSARPAPSSGKAVVAAELPELTTIWDRFAAAALVLSLAAQRQGDVFGLIAFDDRVRAFMPAKNGAAHFNTCRDALYTLQPQRVSPDFAELFGFIGERIRRRALIIFLTSLDDAVLAQSFSRHIDLITRRHLVLITMLQPAAAAPLFSSLSVSNLEDIYRSLAGHLIWRRLRETHKMLRRFGVEFSLLKDENLCADVVGKYLALKRRQVI
jgi:uncharacterized protein (DUF58 family)